VAKEQPGAVLTGNCAVDRLSNQFKYDVKFTASVGNCRSTPVTMFNF